MIDDICQALRTCRLRHGDEKELQDGLERVLIARGFAIRREVSLGGTSGTIDFIVLGRTGKETLTLPIGVEVKIKGAVADIARQLHRYTRSDAIGGIVLATTQLRHVNAIAIRDNLNGKPYRMVHLAGSAF